MAYTVKELSGLSGVSVRTLHYYDEIELLKPNHIGIDGYRYYEEEQLLRLQQIMFYRELDIPLSEIASLLDRTDHEIAAVLEEHKIKLQNKAFRLQSLIQTIEHTVAHVKGDENMRPEQIYKGFDPEKQENYEYQLVDCYGMEAAENIRQTKKRTTQWTEEDYLDSQAEADQIYQHLAETIRQGYQHDSDEVQSIIRRHLKWVSRFYTPTAEIYSGLGDLYVEHEDFRKMYDTHHTGLAEFLRDGMKVLAKRELS